MATVTISDETRAKPARVARSRHLAVDRRAEEHRVEAVEARLLGEGVRRPLDAIAPTTPSGVEKPDGVALVREDLDR